MSFESYTQPELFGRTPQERTIVAISQLGNRVKAIERNAGTIDDQAVEDKHIKDRTVTKNKIVANTITANEIASRTITANNIVTETITAAEIATRTITANQIESFTITSNEIQGFTITGAKIFGGTITADKISTASLSAISTNMGALTAGTITGGTVQTATANPRVVFNSTGITAYNAAGQVKFQANAATGQITATAVVTSEAGSALSTLHLAGTITETQVSDNAISTPKLQAGSVQATKISVASLSVMSANAGVITAGTLQGTDILTGTTGSRVTITGAGLIAYDADESVTLVIPTSNAPTQLAGRVIATGGFEMNAAYTSPASYLAKTRWVDTGGAEICNLFGAGIGYGGRTAASLTAGCQVSGAYRSRVLAHANIVNYYRLGVNGHLDQKGTTHFNQVLNDTYYGDLVPGLINDPDLARSWSDDDWSLSTEGGPPVSSAMNPGGNPFSWSVWIYTTKAPTTSTNDVNGHFLRAETSGGVPYIRLKWTAANRIRADITTGSGTYTITSSSIFALNTKYHVVLRWSGTAGNSMTLYVNDILQGTVTTAGSVPTVAQFDAGIDRPSPENNWWGYLDELSMYNAVIARTGAATDHVTDLYNTGLTGNSTAISITERVILDANGGSQFMQQPPGRIGSDLVYYQITGGAQIGDPNVWSTIEWSGPPVLNRGGFTLSADEKTITLPYTGVYQFSVHLQFASKPDNALALVDTTTNTWFEQWYGDATDVVLSTLRYLPANTNINANFLPSSGGTPGLARLQIAWLGA